MGNEKIYKTREEKDLGMTIRDDLSPEKHINKVTGEVYNLLRNIRLSFTFLDEEMMRKLIVSMIRPKLEYAAIICWSAYKKKHINKIERI